MDSYIAYFFGGVFLVNAIPHLIAGLMGLPFQTPLAKPPGKGLSSSRTNIAWGFLNLVIYYVLIFQVGNFNVRSYDDIAVAAGGGFIMAWGLAHSFGRWHGGNNPPQGARSLFARPEDGDGLS